jgi:pilus assembly protein TadC
MNIIYVIGSCLSFLGVIILLTGFRKSFGALNLTQKLGIFITTIGFVVPFFVGFISNR